MTGNTHTVRHLRDRGTYGFEHCFSVKLKVWAPNIKHRPVFIIDHLNPQAFNRNVEHQLVFIIFKGFAGFDLFF